MADIFHEVDEEVRRERLKRLWDRYSLLIIAVAVLIVAGIGGWRAYEWYTGEKASVAGAQFEAAALLSEQGKRAEAEAAFIKAAADAPEGYRVLARFRAAQELTAQNKTAEAAKAYEDLAADRSLSPLWQDLAGVRAGFLLVDTAPFADMKRRLEPLTASGRSFRHSARELLALSAWREKDLDSVKTYLDMLSGDAETPPGIRARADVLTALLAAARKS